MLNVLSNASYDGAALSVYGAAMSTDRVNPSIARDINIRRPGKISGCSRRKRVVTRWLEQSWAQCISYGAQ